MQRSSWLLFFIPVVIWSTTFFAITFQLNSSIGEIYSVAIRFFIGSSLIFIWLIARKNKLCMSKIDHALALSSGILAYGVSYVLTYVSERVIPSGLVAIAFTLMVFFTPLFARWAYRQPISRATWIGGSLGVLGVALCFLPPLLLRDSTAIATPLAAWAVAAMLLASLVSSMSSVISMRLNQRGVPVTTYTAWAMLYGSIATFAYAFITGESFAWDQRLSYWGSLAYLTLFGTVFTFLCYLELLRREGSARTMYISVLSPIGALFVSIVLENLSLDPFAWLGIVCALIGAWYTLRGKSA